MRLRGKTAILAIAALMATAHAQLPLNPETANQNGIPGEIGGTPTIDVITFRTGMFGLPLRYGGVLPGSERVEYNGRTLAAGTDYQIDRAGGVIYMMITLKAGDQIRVGYRYDEAKVAQQTQRSQFSGLAPYRLELAPGSLSMIVGFGMTERQSDGNVLQSSLYGLNSSFRFGSASTKGMLLFGNRQKIEQNSDYEFRGDTRQTDVGRSHFALQNMALALGGGGSIEVNYQDISRNFSGFSALQDSDIEAARLKQLEKERGLKRLSIGMKDLAVGGLKFSGQDRSVGDGKDDIDWQSMSLAGSGFNISWKSQKVGQKFGRFQDLAEGDREQLKKEAGMERETLAGEFAQKAGKLKFSISQVLDHENSEIERRELGFESAGFKFLYGDQEVGKDFRRMQSLRGEEQAMWGRELGMHRQWFGIQSSLFGTGQPIAFSQNILSNPLGEYVAENFKWSGKGWSFEHLERNASSGFRSFGAMQDPERNEHINSIGRMYDPNGVPFRGEEVQWFNRSAGISRSLTRIQSTIFNGWKVGFDHLELAGRNDTATLDTFALEGNRLKINYRSQDLGGQFGELSSLLELERNRLGVISGLERTDFNVGYMLDPKRKFLYSSMNAQTPAGGASRQSFNYDDPRLKISMTSREVDPGFVNVNQLVDPEKDFLAAIRGFSERDVKASWQLTPNLKFDMFLLDSASASLDQNKYIHNYELTWKPSNGMALTARRYESSNDDPINLLFANSVDFVSFVKDFGRLGKLSYMSEDKRYDGLNANLADSHKRYMGYETKIDKKTSLLAEKTETRYEDGAKEDIATNTVSTELGKNMGVSVSQMSIDRDGDTRDEKKRNYGFWLNLGNGIKLIYGYAQHRNVENGTNTENQNVTLNGGQVGNVNVSNGQYQQNYWEGGRTQSMGNLGISTVKPFSVLGISNLKINVSLDTAADRGNWLKENHLVQLGGNLGTNAFGLEYKGQIAPNGMRGIDRLVHFTTDQSGTRKYRLSVKYKERSLPTGDKVIIRDYSFVAKPFKNFELSHNLLTNPEVARGDVILGSITQARRENRWKLDYNSGPNFVVGGEWREFSDQGQALTRLGGLNVTFNKAIGSPVSLFYGVEESDSTGKRTRNDRYHIRFDQKPGPHQQFSFFIGNVSYLRGINQGQNRNNLTFQLDFQIKF